MVKTSTIFLYSLLCFLLINTSNSLFAQLVNPNATKEALELKALLDSIYGKKIISGQMNDSYLSYIQSTTKGKSPAIMGYDFNGICPSQDGNNDAEKAIKWVKEKGGIAQFNWHWISPNADGDWSTENFKLDEALADTSSSSYKNMIRDMDLVAEELKHMQEEGIAVLWRPLHEAEGGWFWWGMSGGEACKALYRLMYNRYVNYHGLNNLIWVWNSYGTTKENWYPGDDVVDIIAWDYPDYSESGSWSQYEQLFGDRNKLFGIGEDGTLINPDLLGAQPWLYFLTWAYMVRSSDYDNGKNSSEWLFQVYNDPRVLTLDDLSPGAKAHANPSKTYFDLNNDGYELVGLDASSSFAGQDSIVSYHWFTGGEEIASGIQAEVEMGIGYHIIGLKILTKANVIDTAYTVAEIKRASLAYKKSFKVSSTESGLGNIPENAVDGDLSTRWSSAYSDPQWYQIDLGQKYDITDVVIYWQNASAKDYRIELSDDEINWSLVTAKVNMPAGERIDSLSNLTGAGRYLRMYGSKRTNSYGYSIFEFEVYGAEPEITEKITSIHAEDITSFKVYPTPVKNGQYLNLGPKTGDSYPQIIYSSSGKVIKEFALPSQVDKIMIDHTFLPGVYFLVIPDSRGKKVIKFIVK